MASHPTRLTEQIADGLDELAHRVRRLHLHLDVDVLDEKEGRANAFAAPFGLTGGELRDVTRLAGARFEIVSVSVTAYDPAIDTTGAIPTIVVAALETLFTR